jgi:hypothetical protein
MDLGPFEAAEAEQIEQILQNHHVSYEIEVDEKLKQSQLDNFNGQVNNNPTATIGSLDLRYIYFFISDEDCRKVSKDLKPFGIQF